MATLTVTARGQVTFRRDVLQHLGIQPGEKIVNPWFTRAGSASNCSQYAARRGS